MYISITLLITRKTFTGFPPDGKMGGSRSIHAVLLFRDKLSAKYADDYNQKLSQTGMEMRTRIFNSTNTVLNFILLGPTHRANRKQRGYRKSSSKCPKLTKQDIFTLQYLKVCPLIVSDAH